MPQADYLFVVGPASLLPAPDGFGLDEASPLERVEAGRLAAWVCRVPAEQFTGPDSESRLEDLEWVGPRACRHAAVIDDAQSQAPVFPARFGTLFSARDRLRGFLLARQEPLCHFLEEVEGKREWAVKLFLDRTAAEQRLSAESLKESEALLAGLSPGLRYVRERAIRGQARAGLLEWYDGVQAETFEALSAHATHFHERELLASTKGEPEMTANWAFLIQQPPSGFLEEVARQKQRLGDALRLECSGPWPPYSFAASLIAESAA